MKNSTRYKIPKKYEDAIGEVYKDDDGIWVLLNVGFFDSDMGGRTIHVDDGKELRSALTNICRVTD